MSKYNKKLGTPKFNYTPYTPKYKWQEHGLEEELTDDDVDEVIVALESQEEVLKELTENVARLEKEVVRLLATLRNPSEACPSSQINSLSSSLTGTQAD